MITCSYEPPLGFLVVGLALLAAAATPAVAGGPAVADQTLQIRCEVVREGARWQARVELENPGSEPVEYQLSATARAGTDMWRSEPITGRVDPSARVEQTFRPFPEGRAIDGCQAQIVSERILPRAPPRVHPAFVENFLRRGTRQAAIGLDVGLTFPIRDGSPLRLGASVGLAGYQMLDDTGSFAGLRVAPRVRYALGPAQSIDGQIGLGLRKGTPLASVGAGYRWRWLRFDLELVRMPTSRGPTLGVLGGVTFTTPRSVAVAVATEGLVALLFTSIAGIGGVASGH